LGVFMSPRRFFSTIIFAGCLLSPMSNTQAPAQEVNAADEPVKPLQFLTNDKFLTAAQVGIGIAVDLNPETKAIKEAADFTKIVMDQSVQAADFRNSVVESHLLVVKEEAETLRDIRQREGNLNSPEAQAILRDLKAGHFSQDGAATFLLKSVFSLRMAYGVASEYATKKLTGKIAGKLAGQLPTGDRVELMWISKRSYVRTHFDIPWRHLKELGENSKLLTNAFQKVILKKIGERIGRYSVESTLDKTVEDILRDHPSIPEAAYVLRLDAMVQPQLLAPIAAQPAMVAAPMAMPAVIRTQPDPVIRAASVQQQVIAAQPYGGGSSGSGSGRGSNYDPPVERHPTHNLPSNINIGGSWTGGSGGTLFTRF
jgi:hypothetical protein